MAISKLIWDKEAESTISFATKTFSSGIMRVVSLCLVLRRADYWIMT